MTDKRVTVINDSQPASMCRLSAAERRRLLDRLGAHLPLLVGTGGHVLIGRHGDARAAELWHGDTFVVGYLWKHGHVRDAAILLPHGRPIVVVDIRRNAA
jgi:hypothetical protein